MDPTSPLTILVPRDAPTGDFTLCFLMGDNGRGGTACGVVTVTERSAVVAWRHCLCL